MNTSVHPLLFLRRTKSTAVGAHPHPIWFHHNWSIRTDTSSKWSHILSFWVDMNLRGERRHYSVLHLLLLSLLLLGEDESKQQKKLSGASELWWYSRLKYLTLVRPIAATWPSPRIGCLILSWILESGNFSFYLNKFEFHFHHLNIEHFDIKELTSSMSWSIKYEAGNNDDGKVIGGATSLEEPVSHVKKPRLYLLNHRDPLKDFSRRYRITKLELHFRNCILTFG